MATHDISGPCELGGRIGIMKHGCLVDERDASNITAVQLEQAYLAHMRANQDASFNRDKRVATGHA